MSKQGGGSGRLRPVPSAANQATAEQIEDGSGLTPPQKRKGSRFISDVIVELNYAPRERVDAAVEEAKSSGRTPEQVLLESGAINSDQLARATAQRFGLQHADLTTFKADVGALNLINPQAAKRFNAVPIGFDGAGALLVAMADPSNVIALDDMKLMTGHEVQPVVSSSDDIAGVIGRMSRLDDAVAAAVEQGEEELAEVTEIRESAEDARVGLTVEGHAIDLRVVSMPSVHGEGVVMRILDKEQALIGLDALGMSPD